MKLGIKKIHENEWQVHVGCAMVRLDRFSLELLNITLEHLEALENGESHSMLASYTHLAEQVLQLSPANLQVLLRSVANEDILRLIQTAQNDQLTEMVLANVGGILSKQLQADIEKSVMPGAEEVMGSVRRVIEKMFELEDQGTIEFKKDNQRYI
ncbi:MAG: FliG C-terminal domain-containing protein [Hydrogenovibrio sp.]|nr:FliG C-terminal domain-containing protein [Hydrogenovibrio sp.]